MLLHEKCEKKARSQNIKCESVCTLSMAAVGGVAATGDVRYDLSFGARPVPTHVVIRHEFGS